MLLGVPLSEILWLALAIVIGGVITGLLAGLFGIGGGAVIVPVLYEVFRVLNVPDEVRMQLCVGTSLAIILPTTIRSYLDAPAKGSCRPERHRLWALPAVIGVICGAHHRGIRAGRGIQDRIRCDRDIHRDKISVRRRPLEPRHRTARSAADDEFTDLSSGLPVR